MEDGYSHSQYILLACTPYHTGSDTGSDGLLVVILDQPFPKSSFACFNRGMVMIRPKHGCSKQPHTTHHTSAGQVNKEIYPTLGSLLLLPRHKLGRHVTSRNVFVAFSKRDDTTRHTTQHRARRDECTAMGPKLPIHLCEEKVPIHCWGLRFRSGMEERKQEETWGDKRRTKPKNDLQPSVPP